MAGIPRPLQILGTGGKLDARPAGDLRALATAGLLVLVLSGCSKTYTITCNEPVDAQSVVITVNGQDPYYLTYVAVFYDEFGGPRSVVAGTGVIPSNVPGPNALGLAAA